MKKRDFTMFRLDSFKTFDSTEGFSFAVYIRKAVFIDEQKAPSDTEPDVYDTENCWHWLIYPEDSTKPVGTGRMFPDENSPKLAHIGSMTILKDYRNKGLGGIILEDMLKKASSLGFEEIVLDAQCYVQHFYKRLGFFSEGKEFIWDGIPHIRMRKLFTTEDS